MAEASAPEKQPLDEPVCQRARTIAGRNDYNVAQVHATFAPAEEGGEWEVLFVGRYRGNTKAQIPGDPSDAKLPYRCWLSGDDGYVTEGW